MAKKVKKAQKQNEIQTLNNGEINISGQILSKEQQKAFDILQNTQDNVFIQGQAGTGKSSFIMYLKKNLTKSMIICSPTAVAAMNIGGQTIHSLFKLPISDFLIENTLFKTNRKKIAEVIKRADILVIDEISMVRPDMLDAINKLTKVMRQKANKAFGGLQVLLIGDIYQLPPVITSAATKLFKDEYGTTDPYFFDSYAYHEGNFKFIEFSYVYRQLNNELLDSLTKLRLNSDMSNVLKYFNSCKIKDQTILNTAVTITPYRSKADEINQAKLKALKGSAKKYKADMTGSFVGASTFPADKELILKEGALVMFNKNNQPEWINGSMGIVTELNNDAIFVKMLNNGKNVIVTKETWKNREYAVEINEEGEKEHLKLTETKLLITALFGSPREVVNFRCGEKQCKPEEQCPADECSILNKDFPIENELIQQLIEIITTKLAAAIYKPADPQNNSTDDMASIQAFIRQAMKDKFVKETQS